MITITFLYDNQFQRIFVILTYKDVQFYFSNALHFISADTVFQNPFLSKTFSFEN